jgi:peptidoglycan hydrolase CwlO-like protein
MKINFLDIGFVIQVVAGVIVIILFIVMVALLLFESPKKDTVAIKTAKSINYTTEQIKQLQGEFKALEDRLDKAEGKQKELAQDYDSWTKFYRQMWKGVE